LWPLLWCVLDVRHEPGVRQLPERPEVRLLSEDAPLCPVPFCPPPQPTSVNPPCHSKCRTLCDSRRRGKPRSSVCGRARRVFLIPVRNLRVSGTVSLIPGKSVRPTSESPTTPNRARISWQVRKFCDGAVRVAVFRTFSAPTGRAGPAAAVPVRQATFSPGGILRFRYCPDRPPTDVSRPAARAVLRGTQNPVFYRPNALGQ
jgi:hypothetical protein